MSSMMKKILQFPVKENSGDALAKLDAINRSQAVIEFNLDGTILDANENFLGAVGYTLDEIRGRHHRMFMPPGEADKSEYKAFWENLSQGKYQAAEYKRVGIVAEHFGAYGMGCDYAYTHVHKQPQRAKFPHKVDKKAKAA